MAICPQVDMHIQNKIIFMISFCRHT